MSNAAEELTYHGHPLIAQPVNLTMGEIVDGLREGKLVEVILEPGDATRYDLLIGPVSGDGLSGQISALLVGRTTGRGGDFREGTLLGDPIDSFDYADQIGRLSCGNDWSYQLLDWWFTKLWDRIEGRNQ